MSPEQLRAARKCIATHTGEHEDECPCNVYRAFLADNERLRKALSDIMPIAKRGSVSADRWDEYNAAKDVLGAE